MRRDILPTTAMGPASDALSQLPERNRGIAGRYPGDQGIANDAAVLFHDDFESGIPADRWDMVYHRQSIRLADEPQHVHGGARSLELTVPRQGDEVSNELVKRLGDGHDTVFLRYYSKFDAGFDQVGSSHNGGLLAAIAPGVPFATPGVRANGRNKFSASFENWRGQRETLSPGQSNVYCYHPHQRSDYGDHFFPSGAVLPFTSQPGDFGGHFVSRPELTPELGRWYCYEFMLRSYKWCFIAWKQHIVATRDSSEESCSGRVLLAWLVGGPKHRASLTDQRFPGVLRGVCSAIALLSRQCAVGVTAEKSSQWPKIPGKSRA
jgi:hypothetical protein